MDSDEFKLLLRRQGKAHWRDMPWRDDTRPYYVLVSELMLQQTQVSRVVPKFLAFIERFPDEQTLARVPLSEVLRLWQGLGYNRRARYLHKAATMIVHDFHGRFPTEPVEIRQLPGVGANTCGAIQAYAFNQPALFIETNVRTVYIHYFFADQHSVPDSQIRQLLEQTIDRQQPRQFYQALMDYGSYLKASGVRNTRASQHYKKQPPLKGSLREMRGMIVRQLSHHKSSSLGELQSDERFANALDGLQRDGLVQLRPDGTIELTSN